jgi:hypothetical protein
MRADELVNEIAMSPKALQRGAAGVNALVGIEFEMGVPDSSFTYDEQEEDWSYDELVKGIDMMINFFEGSESSRYLSQLHGKIQSAYMDWLREDYLESEWSKDKEDTIRRELKDDDLSEEEIQEIISIPYDRTHRRIKNEYMDEWTDYYSDSYRMQTAFLNDQGVRNVSDAISVYNLSWPYYVDRNTTEVDIDALGDDFRRATGNPVIASKRDFDIPEDFYENNPSTYIFVTDGSIERNDENDCQLEIKSPPVPVTKVQAEIDKVIKWANYNDAYTNDSTGLHINVSLPGVDFKTNLDYVKLVLLVGDNYVLQQFGREAEEYCASMLDTVSNVLQYSDLSNQRVVQAFENARKGMMKSAAEALYTYYDTKRISVHWRYNTNIIEFRGPGGDWLSKPYVDQIMDTVYRFAVALAAAVDPSAYAQEYAKKFYKLVNPSLLRYYDQKNPANIKQPTQFADPAKPDYRRGMRQFVEPSEKDILAAYVEYLINPRPDYLQLKDMIRNVRSARQ